MGYVVPRRTAMKHPKGKERRRLASGALATLLCAPIAAPVDAAIIGIVDTVQYEAGA